MVISKTQVKSRVERKTNPVIAQTIRVAVKEKAWFEVAKKLSGATRQFISVNLSDISNSKEVKEGSVVVVVGKVLGQGKLDKKVSIFALSFAESAKEKLSKAKVQIGTILEQINKNPKATGVVVLK